MIARCRASAMFHALLCAWAFVFAFIPPIPGPWWMWLVISFVALIVAAFSDNLADEAEQREGRIDP